MVHQITIKPSQVYTDISKENLMAFLARTGLQILGFRPPKDGDIYIGHTNKGLVSTQCTADFEPVYPRFIVQYPKPPTKLVAHVTPLDVYYKEDQKSLERHLKDRELKIVTFRVPQEGDDYISLSMDKKFGEIKRCVVAHFAKTDFRLIVTSNKEGEAFWE